MAVVAIALTAMATLGAVLALQVQRAAHPLPSSSTDESTSQEPAIDWEYWLEVNPDIIGWITVPGTQISQPIVQAPEDDPDFYLDHDVYGKWNYAGCPYLDASCREGFESRNVLIYGHDFAEDSGLMFAPLARYSDAQYAESRRLVVIQRPQKPLLRYDVQAVEVIPGWDRSKRTEFDGLSDFRAWLQERFDKACVVFDPATPMEASTVLTLCTCSYTRWESERTLLYATPRFEQERLGGLSTSSSPRKE